MFLVSSCSCLCSIQWSQVLSREWRCSWSSADRRCSNYIWVIDNLITHQGAAYIRDLTVCLLWFCLAPGHCPNQHWPHSLTYICVTKSQCMWILESKKSLHIYQRWLYKNTVPVECLIAFDRRRVFVRPSLANMQWFLVPPEYALPNVHDGTWDCDWINPCTPVHRNTCIFMRQLGLS